MGHIQHLSFESLVKIDHFQKEPPLNLKGTTGAKGSEIPVRLKSALGHKRTFAPQKAMSALPPKADIRRTRLLDHGLRLFVSKWARRATRGYNCDISMGTAAPMVHHLTGFRGSDGQSQAQIHD